TPATTACAFTAPRTRPTSRRCARGPIPTAHADGRVPAYCAELTGRVVGPAKQGDRRGEAVDEVLPAHRSELAVAEQPGNGEVAQRAGDRRRIVIHRPEQAGAAAVATAQQRSAGLPLPDAADRFG